MWKAKFAQMKDCVCAYMGCCDGWMRIVNMLSKIHTSLRRVTIVDSEKRGKLVVGEEQLVRLRSCALEPLDGHDVARAYEAYASVPVLHLPLLGYVMRKVFLLIINYSTESSANSIEEIVSWDFEEKVKVLGEVVEIGLAVEIGLWTRTIFIVK